MNEIEKIEFEIEKLKARLIQFKRVSEVLEISPAEVQIKYDEMLDKMSVLIKKLNKLKE